MKTDRTLSSKNSQQTIPQIARRTFLLNGVLATGAIGFGIRKVFAQARIAGKPALTEATMNRLLTSGSPEKYREICLAVQKDLPGFIRKTFYLTPQQEKAVAALTPEQIQTVQGGLKSSMDKGIRAKVQLEAALPKGGNPQLRQRLTQAALSPTGNFMITTTKIGCITRPDGTEFCLVKVEREATPNSI